MIARTIRAPKASFFLLGPRGTGKSTWVGTILPDALRVDLLEQSTFVELLGHADRLEAMADANRRKTVIIDEVQKLPALRVHVTGVAARAFRRCGVATLRL
ncbi:MAG: AAA family ATPase [candidate division NC10 bacterium]